MENKNTTLKKEIYCRYIRKNGKIIYPKKSKFFHFWVDCDETATEKSKQLSTSVVKEA